MQFAVLGPLEVVDGAGQPVPITGARVRALIARLAVDAGRAVSLAALAQTIWGDEPPAEQGNALQTLVSRARRGLGSPALVTQSAAGYRLEVEPTSVDVHVFASLAAAGAAAVRTGEHDAALRDLDAALGLWRGDPLVDAMQFGDALAPQVTRLTELQVQARADRAEATLAAHPEQAPAQAAELEAMVAAAPLDERLTGLLVRALAMAGRQAEALAAYARVRGRLADELGVDPSPELQQVQLAVLRGEYGQSAARAAPRRTNLKAQLTSFVGRDAEVARIAKSLEQNRLVTLVGPGGAGKTRLACEAAARVLDAAPDGTWLVELAQLTSGADVAQAVVAALGLREAHVIEWRGAPTARDAMSRLLDALADTRTLLVLDNCEHVIEAAARLTDQLLADNAQLRILATSREPLGIIGEALLAVPSLGQPQPSAGVDEALDYPAVRLFADRAAAVRPDFAVDATTVGDVIEIVRRLDGLPLAIELAAARLRTLPLSDIAARLTDRFRLLTGGSRTALPRHRTLRAVVEWSWELLTPAERRLVEQLSVFPSGITVESAAAVSDTPDDVPELLPSLIDKSLLVPVGDGTRLRMLETIREYGAERLGERGELAEVRRRHADHFAQVLATAEPHLTSGDQLPWFAMLATELDNIVAALRCRCDLGDADGALRIAVSLGGYAMLLGNHPDIPGWVNDALAVAGPVDWQLRAVARALVALSAASLAIDSSTQSQSRDDLRAIAEELREVDADRWSPTIHLLRAAAAYFADLPDLAQQYMAEAAASDQPWARAVARMFHASLAENEGDLAGMRVAGDDALAQFRAVGERWGTTNALRIVAQLAVLDGDLDAGAAGYEEALRLAREINSRDDEGFLLGRLADVQMRCGDIAAARANIEQARSRAEESGSPLEAVFAWAVLGGIEREAGNDEEARRCQAKATERLAELPVGHPTAEHLRAMLLGIGIRQALADDEVEQARAMALDAYPVAVGTKDFPILAAVGVAVAALFKAEGDGVGAAQRLGASARLRGSDDHTALDVRELTLALTEALGAERFAAEYGRGKALDREAAIERLDPR